MTCTHIATVCRIPFFIFYSGRLLCLALPCLAACFARSKLGCYPPLPPFGQGRRASGGQSTEVGSNTNACRLAKSLRDMKLCRSAALTVRSICFHCTQLCLLSFLFLFVGVCICVLVFAFFRLFRRGLVLECPFALAASFGLGPISYAKKKLLCMGPV